MQRMAAYELALLSGTIKALLAKQVTAPVLWEDTMQNMIDGGYEKGYELGPGKVVAGVLKRIDRKAKMTNVEV